MAETKNFPDVYYVVVCWLSGCLPEIVGIYDTYEKAQKVINTETDERRFNNSYVVERQLNLPERATNAY